MRLTAWPIDRYRRRRPSSRREPLVLVDATPTRQTVAVACDAARSHGVRPGMSLAEARALCGGLTHAPHDPAGDLRGLASLGRWLMRFTPDVAPEPPDGVFLDVGGCERLFGGLDRLRQMVLDGLGHLRLGARAVIAPTPGAAWALASAEISAGHAVVGEDQLWPALRPLRPALLRISPAVAAALGNLGIETIGQLVDLPRGALPVRFGTELLRRVDQALGRLPEPLALLPHPAPVGAAIRFDGPVESLEAVWVALDRLVGRVVADLGRRGCGARLLQARFERDGRPPVERAIRLSSPSRDRANLVNLLRCATETVRTGDGFTGIALAVPVFERLAEGQSRLAGQEEPDGAAEFDRLVDRLRARLGAGAVEAAELVASHLPERACRYVEAAGGSPARAAVPPVDPDARPPTAPRPLHLLPTPVEIGVTVTPSADGDGRPVSFTHAGDVHRVAYAIGPERVAGVWWDGHHKTRDYFEVEDPAGRCFWVFRVSPSGRWFLHGHFA